MTIFVGYLEVSFEVKFLSYSLFCFFYSYYIQYHLISIVFFHDLLLLCCFVTIYSLVDHLLNLSACSFSLHFLFIKTFCTFSTVKFTPINNHMLYARNRNAWERSVIRAQNQQEAHQADIKRLFLVSLLTILNKFYSLPRYTNCLWNKY